MNKFYKQLYLDAEEDGYKLAEQESKKMYKQQKKDREELLQQVGKILLSYTIVSELLKINKKDIKGLNKEFSTLINSITKNEFTNEKDITNNILNSVAKNRYYKNGYITSIGVDFNLQTLTNKQLKNIVNTQIEGKLWSERIWTNKKKLEKVLKKEINSFLKGKTNINKIEKIIKKKFDQNAYNTHRLVETEVCRCQSGANEVFAQEHGVAKQQFMATLDNRTSHQCQSLDGTIYDIDDIDKPIPPLHALCRSVLVSLPADDWKPNLRIDNITKEYIPYVDYPEWLANQDLN